MTILMIALPLSLIMVVAVFVIASGKRRLTLRGMLLITALVAIVIAATLGYRRASMASLVWLDPQSNVAQSLFPSSSVEKDATGNCHFVYYARNRSTNALATKLQNVSFTIRDQMIEVRTPDEVVAREQLRRLQAADVRPKDAYVIRGRIRRRNGEPLANATIDILGGFMFINCWTTRPDGTFTLALTERDPNLPAGRGYYFRIRDASDSAERKVRWHSAYFELDSGNAERVAEIVVP